MQIESHCMILNNHQEHVDRFAKVIRKQGYQQGQSNHTLFFRQSDDVKRAILIVYINDIILTKENLEEISKIKKKLGN